MINNINNNDAMDFLNLMDEYTSFYQKFMELEKLKMGILSLNQQDRLDQHVKEEEAFLMQAKGLEQKRESFLNTYQLNGNKMRDIIPLFPEPYQKDITLKFNELSDIIVDLKEINTRCNTMTELRLYKIQKRIAEMQDKAKQENGRIKITKKSSQKEGKLSERV